MNGPLDKQGNENTKTGEVTDSDLSSDENENNKLNKQIIFATKKLKNLVIFGDFNHPSIDWDSNYTKKSENHCDSRFLFEVLNMNTNQLITSPTHHKPNCKPTHYACVGVAIALK